MSILIRGKTACSICAKTINEGDEAVGSPHFIQDEHHPLWRYSDSSMHQACFRGWPHADEFRTAFDELWPQLVPEHPRAMMSDGSIVPRDAGNVR